MVSKNYKNLFKAIPDLKEAIENHEVAIYPFKESYKYQRNGKWIYVPKQPDKIKGKEHGEYWQKQPELKWIKNKKNFSFIIGYDPDNKGSHLAVIDIDGFKKEPPLKKDHSNHKIKYWYDWNYHIQSCNLLYNILKDIDIDFILCKTWSGGYHLYYKSKEKLITSDLSILNFIKYPDNWKINELRGKGITEITDTVEVIAKSGVKKVITYPSKVKDWQINHETDEIEIKQGKYELLNKSDNNKIRNLKPVEDIATKLLEVFTKHGFKYDKIAHQKHQRNNETIEKKYQKNQITTNKKISLGSRELTENEIDEIGKALGKPFELSKGSHNELYPALENILSTNEINLETIIKIGYRVGKYSNDIDEEHIKQMEASYNSNKVKKTGLPHLIKTLEKNVKKEQVNNAVRTLTKIVESNKQTLNKSQIGTISYMLEDYFYHEYLFNNENGRLTLFGSLIEWLEIYNISDSSIMEIVKRLIGGKDKLKGIIDIHNSTNNKNETQYSDFKENLSKLLKISSKKIDEVLKNILLIIDPILVFHWLTEQNTHKLQLKASGLLESEYNIKRTQDTFYYFDGKFEKYSELKSRTLGLLLANKYGVSLQDKQLDSILSGIQKLDIPNPYIWGFKNGLLDIRDGTFIENKKEIFTIKYFGLTDELTGEFQPFTYTSNVNTAPNWNHDDVTLTQKVIQEILIPKNDKNNETLYYDHLQRGGSNYHPINKSKKITVYYNNFGNNGKEIIKLLLTELTINEFNASIKSDQYFTDNFIDSTILKNKHRVILDEVKKNTFLGKEDEMKRRSSGGRGLDTRKINSDEVYTAETNPMQYILSNLIFNVDLDDTAFLYRTNFLELPNIFVEKKEENLEANEYIMDFNLDEKLKNDFEGIEWYVNAQIKEYLKNNEGSFLASQTAYETLMIVNKDNPIQNWFNLHIEPTNKKENIITNKEIVLELKAFIKDNKIEYDIESDRKFSIAIGNWMKEYFETQMHDNWENVKIKNRTGIVYEGFKIKTKEQIKKDYNTNYVIDEDT